MISVIDAESEMLFIEFGDEFHLVPIIVVIDLKVQLLQEAFEQFLHEDIIRAVFKLQRLTVVHVG